MSNHTPGPWKVTAYGDSYTVETHTHTTTESRDADYQLCKWSEKTEKTAMLIAAAPGLLDACKKAVPVLEEMERILSKRIGWTSVSFPELVALRAEIAKAVETA